MFHQRLELLLLEAIYFFPGVARKVEELKGFGRVEVEPGESVDLEIEILDQDLCYYDPENGWTLEACAYEFWLADSAEDLQLRLAWSFDGEAWQSG